jgi:bifunctional UDP-N-acetylglucosamine pyrophosphorylase/glucosamine-1-phosphate N-acetyltransferase
MRGAQVTAVRPAAVIVLAAGGGTRMRSATPKVLHTIGGRTLLGHALAAAGGLDADRLVVVLGSGREAVEPHVRETFPDAAIVVQERQLGTGHAVQVALDQALADVHGVVVVTYGDVPLQTTAILHELVDAHVTGSHAVTILTAEPGDPFGYGRIIRDDSGAVVAVVEEKDATDKQREVTEINSGIFAFDAAVLRDCLARADSDNAAGELYLTDVVGLASSDGLPVAAVATPDTWQTEGANTRSQLSALGRELNSRVLQGWMDTGVEVIDPTTTWVDVTVELAPDVALLPGVQLHGTTRVGRGARIGPDTTLTDVQVGEAAQVIRTHGSGAVLGAGTTVGPFAYLRPGTVLGAGGKIGTFVETKNADIGPGAKVPHLSYVGDADIGEGTNIGAGTIFANYDGVTKNHTTVGAHCRTASHNTFVAPVVIGDGAATGAGTVVRRNVPPGALAVSSGPQRHIEGWVQRKRPGSAAARAAEAALDQEAEQ